MVAESPGGSAEPSALAEDSVGGGAEAAAWDEAGAGLAIGSSNNQKAKEMEVTVIQ
jgi:hypothetical protein